MSREVPDDPGYVSLYDENQKEEVASDAEKIERLELKLQITRHDAANAWKQFRTWRRRAQQAESVIAALQAVLSTTQYHNLD